MKTFSNLLVEITDTSLHPDISTNPDMQKRVKEVMARREAKRQLEAHNREKTRAAVSAGKAPSVQVGKGGTGLGTTLFQMNTIKRENMEFRDFVMLLEIEDFSQHPDAVNNPEMQAKLKKRQQENSQREAQKKADEETLRQNEDAKAHIASRTYQQAKANGDTEEQAKAKVKVTVERMAAAQAGQRAGEPHRYQQTNTSSGTTGGTSSSNPSPNAGKTNTSSTPPRNNTNTSSTPPNSPPPPRNNTNTSSTPPNSPPPPPPRNNTNTSSTPPPKPPNNPPPNNPSTNPNGWKHIHTAVSKASERQSGFNPKITKSTAMISGPTSTVRGGIR